MRRLMLALALCLLAPLARAQDAATLVADQVSIPAGGDRLVAQGNVEIFYEGTRVSAARITYDQPSDRLIIEGPIFIVTPDGTILTASSAELDPRLRNGLLRGARLILEEQLQLAANRIDRVDGRYTALTQTVATSCHVCADGRAPLWDIRASRVVHDTEERQLYFDNAQFRVMGVPIFWVPRMRLPDPTLTRATGLLLPELRTTDRLGLGLKLPYFITLGDHRDLTLTPYLSPETRTLEARYRQAWLRGELTLSGAVTDDTLTDITRAYLFADGTFRTGDQGRIGLRLRSSSDSAYLLDYGYGDQDRLDSRLSYDRITDRQMIRGELALFQSLRDDDDSDLLPPLLGEASWERRTSPGFGGTLSYGADLQGHLRTSRVDVTGRDVIRTGLSANWTNSVILTPGLVIEGDAGLRLDYYGYADDSLAEEGLRGTAHAATTLRYPLARQTARATHLLEPVLHLAWSETWGITPVNEDSTAGEFDQTSLFALSRFAGQDAVETGARAALGLRWTRAAQNGATSRLSFGRILRAEANTAYTPSSGLAGAYSDWLLAGRLELPTGIAFEARAVIDDTWSVTRSEALLAWQSDRIDLSASYIFLPADLAEDRPDMVSELAFDSTYRIDDRWTVGLDGRYDVAADEPSRAGLRLGWRNECVEVDFSVSRRFSSSITVPATTDFGLSVGLSGFSAGRSGASPPARHCRN